MSCILVNDGSTKGIREMDITLLQSEIPNFTFKSYSDNKGKGHALRFGIRQSEAEFTVFTDVDFPFTLDSNIALIQSLIEGKADVVIGSRSSSYHAKQPRMRRWISKFLRGLNKSLLRLKVYDTQCGLKGFNKTGRELFLQTKLDRYLFDLEFIHLVSKSQATILPIDVALREDVVFSSIPLKVLISEGIDFIKILLK